MALSVVWLFYTAITLGIIKAEELDSAKLSVRFDGQVCTAELSTCSVKGGGYLGSAVGGGIKGEKGDMGIPGLHGISGLKGEKGDPGTCGNCPPITGDDSRGHGETIQLGSKDRPAPWICKFRPDGTAKEDSIWVMESQPFRVACNESAYKKATCLILDKDKYLPVWLLDYTNERGWSSQNGNDVLNLYEISETQLRFLKAQSNMVTQKLKVYTDRNLATFEDIDLEMLSWNDQIISLTTNPLKYEIVDKNQECFLYSEKFYCTELEVTGSARSLPVVDFRITLNRKAILLNMRIELTELCFY